jgi:hypothetical protein
MSKADGPMSDHDINAYYALGQDGYMLPVLDCTCGFRAREANWEDAGAAMDAHLQESR